MIDLEPNIVLFCNAFVTIASLLVSGKWYLGLACIVMYVVLFQRAQTIEAMEIKLMVLSLYAIVIHKQIFYILEDIISGIIICSFSICFFYYYKNTLKFRLQICINSIIFLGVYYATNCIQQSLGLAAIPTVIQISLNQSEAPPRKMDEIIDYVNDIRNLINNICDAINHVIHIKRRRMHKSQIEAFQECKRLIMHYLDNINTLLLTNTEIPSTKDIVDIKQLIQNCFRVNNLKSRANSIKLKERVSSDVPLFLIDKMLLEQVLLNAIGNAVKHSVNGFTKVKVTRHTGNESPYHIESEQSLRESPSTMIIDEVDQEIIINIQILNQGQLLQDTRGYGMGQTIIKRIAKQLNGEADFYMDSSIYVCNILLPVRVAQEQDTQNKYTIEGKVVIVGIIPHQILDMLNQLGCRIKIQPNDVMIKENPSHIYICTEEVYFSSEKLQELSAKKLVISPNGLSPYYNSNAIFIAEAVEAVELYHIITCDVVNDGHSPPQLISRPLSIQNMQFSPIQALVIDDEPFSAKIAAMMLNSKCQCLIFYSGKHVRYIQGYKYYMQNHFFISLVLIDLIMPEIDGYETTKLIREFEENNGLPKKPIIIMTGDNCLLDKEWSDKFQITNIRNIQTVIKPFDKEQIDDLVEPIIRKSSLQFQIILFFKISIYLKTANIQHHQITFVVCAFTLAIMLTIYINLIAQGLQQIANGCYNKLCKYFISILRLPNYDYQEYTFRRKQNGQILKLFGSSNLQIIYLQTLIIHFKSESQYNCFFIQYQYFINKFQFT